MALSHVDIPDETLQATIARVDRAWAHANSDGTLREGVRHDAGYEVIAIVLEKTRGAVDGLLAPDDFVDFVVRSAAVRWPDFASRLDRAVLGECSTRQRPSWPLLLKLLTGAGLRPKNTSPESLRVGFYQWLNELGPTGSGIRQTLGIAP